MQILYIIYYTCNTTYSNIQKWFTRPQIGIRCQCSWQRHWWHTCDLQTFPDICDEFRFLFKTVDKNIRIPETALKQLWTTPFKSLLDSHEHPKAYWCLLFNPNVNGLNVLWKCLKVLVVGQGTWKQSLKKNWDWPWTWPKNPNNDTEKTYSGSKQD